MKERCTVSLEWVADAGVDAAARKLTLEGPSPVNAGRVANDLARDLLVRARAAGQSEPWGQTSGVQAARVRFDFDFGRLLNFSYEFDADVVRGLAHLGASVAFYHRDGRHPEPPMERFGSAGSPDEGCDVRLRISGAHLDPDAATSRLGVEPSSTGRTKDGAKRFWVLDGAGPRARAADEPIAELLERLPTTSDAWTSVSREHEVHVMVAFRVRQMTGHFDLDAASMRALAACGCGLDASFYDWGPNGADLL